MKLFDEHIVLRFALLFACFLFAAFVPEILNLSNSVLGFIPYFAAIIFVAYISLFYKFPVEGTRRKIRNDVVIPTTVGGEPVRDFEKDLNEQNELHQMMIDVSQEGFWTFDVPTGKVYWSNRVAVLLGAKGVLEDSLSALQSYVMEKDWEKFKKVVMKSLDEGRDFSEVLRLSSPSKNGPSEIVVAGRMQMDAENRPIRVIGSIS